jgi:hypothetical protein
MLRAYYGACRPSESCPFPRKNLSLEAPSKQVAWQALLKRGSQPPMAECEGSRCAQTLSGKADRGSG